MSRRLHPVIAPIILFTAALCAVEGLARFVIPKISKIEGRVQREKTAALAIRHNESDKQKVLIVGNSLLDAGIEFSKLSSQLGSNWTAHRLVMENTRYLDWHYGIENILISGARPSAIVLMLSMEQFSTEKLRGTYSIYHLVNPQSAWAVGAKINAHPTLRASYLLGSISAYYGLHTEIHQIALRHLIPGSTQIADRIAADFYRNRKPEDNSINIKNVQDHANELSTLCLRYRVSCMVSFAPSSVSLPPQHREVLAIGEASGLRSATLDTGIMLASEDFQSDGFHMGPSGAIKFTQAFSARLRSALSSVMPN